MNRNVMTGINTSVLDATKGSYARRNKMPSNIDREKGQWLQSPHMTSPVMHEFIVRVEQYHGCGCPDKIVIASTWHHANQIAGKCIHGNRYSTQNFPVEE